MTDIEVDQSGRIEVGTVVTILAFSNRIRKAIRIPASVKLKVLKQLQARGVKAKMISIRMFVAGLFLLLQDHLEEIERITIDTEFPGRDSEIKGFLLEHIRQRHPQFESDQIVFRQIAKSSAAHHVAWLTYRGDRAADKKVSAKELLEFC